MSKATFSVAPSRPSVEDFLDDDFQGPKEQAPHGKLLTRSVSNPSASTEQLDSSVGLLDQDALMKIGSLLQDIRSENDVKDPVVPTSNHSQKFHDKRESAFMPNQKFGNWSTKQLGESGELLTSQANERHQVYNKSGPSASVRHNPGDQTVHRSWGSVEGIETKTDDYLIAMREKAAIVIQRWYRRVKIRRTAGAAAVRRMMAAKKQEIEARMSYENEEV